MVFIKCPACGYAMMHSHVDEVCACGEPKKDETVKCLKCGHKLVVDRRGFVRIVRGSENHEAATEHGRTVKGESK